MPRCVCFSEQKSSLSMGLQDERTASLHLPTRRKPSIEATSAVPPQNDIFSTFFEGLSKQGTDTFQFIHNSIFAIRDDEDFHTLNGSWKQFPGFSLQSLSNFLATSTLKSGIANKKDTSFSVCTLGIEQNEAQRPLFGVFPQSIVDNCCIAGSNISKHARHWFSWKNSASLLEHTRVTIASFKIHNIFMLSFTTQVSQCGSLDQSEDLNNKERKQVLSSRSAASLGFAQVRGKLDTSSTASSQEAPQAQISDSREVSENPKSAAAIFKVQLPNIENLRSSLPAVSLTELMELAPTIWKTSQGYPDKKKLFSVQDFFKYSQSEGKRLFEELDRDNDGQVTLEDLELAMRKRKLPRHYASEFLHRIRKNWFANSFGWNEFLSFLEQKEPMMLRAYNSLSLSKFGTLQKGQVLASLQSAGLPATGQNVAAMMRCLDVDMDGAIAYGQFHNFMLLLPAERIGEDPRMVWFEAATVVPMAPPVAVPAESVLKSALAGGLACALSTCLMHPIDTMKTRVQASSSLSFPQLVSMLPDIGIKGLYRGSVPAIVGQFSSHGLRTGIFEASKLLLTTVAPSIPELQVQSLASFWSTVLGTAVRIPCEVLKQRLQAGIFNNMGEAIIGTLQQDGPKGFFRGTGATLCREVPFYVAGMGIYAEAKKAMQQFLNRELEPWETIAVGALSGGLAAVCTTPFDVMKTRTMTAGPGMSVSMSSIAIAIIREEGFLALFKGALPRFFWIAPLGAMNFAGYELAKRAMENKAPNDR